MSRGQSSIAGERRERAVRGVGHLWLAVALVLAVAACSGEQASPSAAETAESSAAAAFEPSGQATVAVVALADAQNLHPSGVVNAITTAIQANIMDGLLGFGPDLIPEPRLAESVDISADGKEWTFHLRPNVLFSNGEPVTAEDIKYSIEYVLNDEASGNSFRMPLKNVLESLEVTDPATIVVRLTEPSAVVRESFARLLVVPAELDGNPTDYTQSPMNSMPIGSGPYMITEHSSSAIVLEANPHYWGTKPNIKTIVIRDAGDANALAAMLRSGDAQIGSYDPTAMAGIESAGDLALESSPANAISAFRWDHANSIWADQAVRTAFSLLFDRSTLLSVGFQGRAVAAGQPLPETSPFHNPTIPVTGFDPAAAASLLAEAGWAKNADGILQKGDDLLEFTVGVRSKGDENMVLAMQQAWRDVGIDISVRNFPDISSLVAYANEGAPVLITSGLGVDPGPSLAAYYGARHWGVRWDAPQEVLDMIADANSELDQASRVQKMHDLSTTLADLLPEIYVANTIEGVVHSKDLDGVIITAQTGVGGWLHHAALWSLK